MYSIRNGQDITFICHEFESWHHWHNRTHFMISGVKVSICHNGVWALMVSGVFEMKIIYLRLTGKMRFSFPSPQRPLIIRMSSISVSIQWTHPNHLHGHNDVGDEGQRGLTAYDSHNKLMKRRVHALANKTFEKITGSKQLTRYIHMSFCHLWCGCCSYCSWRRIVFRIHKEDTQSIVDFAANRRQLNDALAHVVDCVCYLLLGCLALVRANSRNSCDIPRNVADNQRQFGSYHVNISVGGCVSECFWKGSPLATIEPRPLSINRKCINKTNVSGTKSINFSFPARRSVRKSKLAFICGQIYLKRLRHTTFGRQ